MTAITATNQDDLLLTPAEAARWGNLAITPSTIRWWCDTGRLPCQRTLGGRRLIRLADLEIFVRQRAARSAGDVR